MPISVARGTRLTGSVVSGMARRIWLTRTCRETQATTISKSHLPPWTVHVRGVIKSLLTAYIELAVRNPPNAFFVIVPSVRISKRRIPRAQYRRTLCLAGRKTNRNQKYSKCSGTRRRINRFLCPNARNHFFMLSISVERFYGLSVLSNSVARTRHELKHDDRFERSVRSLRCH